ncbi:MAG TPA: NADP-dependent malic enzyme [Desulfosalsimonadaceae bacterium]|nr:NADP-dependent malic enzyme [Desulfosalsimonadaceae bacterium]
MDFKNEALRYHLQGKKGKIEIALTKPCVTQRDLSMAYSPGVAYPSLEIKDDPEQIYNYTAKSNLVAVISNGSAVLGLGNIGAHAAKPVMEGKGVLFKRFADIDVFDIELDTADPDEFIRTVQILSPTVGGVNLEDIKAPECFYIEETLQKTMAIPVFHDDQHGTAIISGAALINALEVTGKKIRDIKIVINGAGAAGIACAKFYVLLGARKEHIILCDSRGVIHRDRPEGINPYKLEFASNTGARTLAEAMQGADVFCGYSIGGCVSQAMVRAMADRPIIFALANPDPEIAPEAVKAVRDDAIIATGRSDYPNMVNNVLGFPFIFRGALDVRAMAINDQMKIATAYALADLAKEDVPDSVYKAYGVDRLEFGPEYILPKPFDPRVLLWAAHAVAKAAIESGTAQIEIDLDTYQEQLEARLGKSREVMRLVINKARQHLKTVVFPEGEHPRILRAANIVIEENIAKPVLLGKREKILRTIDELRLDLKDIAIIDPETSLKYDAYCQAYYAMRQRKGRTMTDVKELMKLGRVYAPMMVHMGDADAIISGLTMNYSDTIRPALRIIHKRDDVNKVAGMYMLLFKDKIIFCADTTVNIAPTAEELADIALMSAEMVRRFEIDPHIAMLSFSNFGSTEHPLSLKVKKAAEIAKQKDPGLVIDGEMQADTAILPEILEKNYPFTHLKGSANVLIFPDLEAGNIAYKLLIALGGAEAIGPILMGLKKSVHVLQQDCDVRTIVNMTAIAAVEAQSFESRATLPFEGSPADSSPS